jgi:hypothetical protein
MGGGCPPLVSFLPASETDITEAFDLFDEIYSWLKSPTIYRHLATTTA